MEKWSQEALLPLPGTSLIEERRHYAALVEMNKGRMTADAKALALAARHRLGCDRVRNAMLRACVPGCESVADFVAVVGFEPLEPIDTDTDEGDEELHTLVHESESLPGVSDLMAEVFASFQPEAGAVILPDPATYKGTGLDPGQETPEQIEDSFILNSAAAVFGPGTYSDDAFVSLAGGELDEHQEQLVETLESGGVLDGMVPLLVSAPLSTLLTWTALARRILNNFPKVKEEQKDRLAAGMALSFPAFLVKLGPEVAAEMLQRIFELGSGQTELPPPGQV